MYYRLYTLQIIIQVTFRMSSGGLRYNAAMPGRRFTDDEVRQIRESESSANALAREYGVSHPTILNIRNRRTYRDVDDPSGVDPSQDYSGVKVGPGRLFTDDEVRQIRESESSASALAREYGVSHPTILNIRNRRSYKHVFGYGHYGDVVDHAGFGGPRDLYIRQDALSFLKSLPDGYCPTVVTSPLFSPNFYRTLSIENHLQWQRNMILECIRVAGASGIVVYHCILLETTPHSYIWFKEALISDLRDQNIQLTHAVTWTHASSENDSASSSEIFIFAGKDWESLEGSSKRNMPIFGDVLKMAPNNEGLYGGIQISRSPGSWNLGQHWFYFPDELADMCISLGSGIVFDPLAGIGTIPLAAIRARRHWLACDTRSSLMSVFERDRQQLEPRDQIR